MAMTFLVWALCAAAQAEPAPEFTKFDFARERVGHKLIADATLANPLAADLADVRVTAIYYDQDRELRRSKPVTLPKVARGAAVSFKVEADQVPNFNRYEVYVEYAGKTKAYVGNDPLKPPALKKAAPPKLSALHAKDTPPATFPGDVAVALTVRNLGESEAHEPTAVLTFLGGSGVVHTARVRLEPTVGAGHEDAYLLTVPGVPNYAAMRAGLAWLAAEGPTLAEGGAPPRELGLGKVRVVRLTDGSARITGLLRNGLEKTVQNVLVTFRLGRVSAALTAEGPLKPGAQRAFEVYAPEGPAFDAIGYDLKFEEAADGAKEVPPPPAPTARRTESRRVLEVGSVKIPDAPAARPEGEASKGTPKVELRGLMVVEGNYYRQGDSNKYTGDVYLLRLLMTDEKGNKWEPTPTITLVVYNGKEPYTRVQRIVTKESWRTDASRINGQTVAANTIACDRKTGELWVAFVRTDGPAFEPRADITITLRDVGTWTWKGMGREQKFESAPRSPDPK
jgi:hypothetical protein